MFEIDSRNRVTLTRGDTAAFSCTIVNNDNELRTPQEGDVLTLSIDGLEFEKRAVVDDGQFVFIITGSNTLDLNPGVYTYRVVLTNNSNQWTIIEECFFELLGNGGEEDNDEP